jgi:hypothetical protein
MRPIECLRIESEYSTAIYIFQGCEYRASYYRDDFLSLLLISVLNSKIATLIHNILFHK